MKFKSVSRRSSSWLLILGLVGIFASNVSAKRAPGSRPRRPPRPTQAVDAGAATLSIDGLLAAWRSVPDLTAHFVELKRIAMMRTPLRSEGEISFVSGSNGVLVRDTASPTPSSVRVSSSELVIREGGRREVIALSSNAAVRGFVATFRDILAGDHAALNARYRIILGPGSHGDWDMQLVPRDPQLARFLRELHIHGSGSSITGMRMIEQNGDETETMFSNVRAPRNYTAAERAALIAR